MQSCVGQEPLQSRGKVDKCSVMSSVPLTHEVANQPPPLTNYNLFSADPLLRGMVEKSGAAWGLELLNALGQTAGTEAVFQWGFEANENPPLLKTHDRFGHRLDVVAYHPAWHELMRLSIGSGLHHLPWKNPRPGAHGVRAAMYLALSQIEQGHFCPITMTFAAWPALEAHAHPTLWAMLKPKLLSNVYDPSFKPLAEKHGMTCGMAMTEKQGGSDVRANTTVATFLRDGELGKEYRLTGHKWFCSAPMSDAFLVLAQAPRGLSCFYLPRWTPDGKKNAFFIQRLKNKLGNRSNASSEVEFNDTWAVLLGEEGRGVPTIITMVNHTRLDCVLGSTALMRQALSQAMHHSRYRKAFGHRLIRQPLMRQVLADLSLDVEAAVLVSMRLAQAYDKTDEASILFRRLATAVSKYWVCKQTPAVVGEALECLGGNGYVEESIFPRLYREAPLNSIWEGSGNVNSLDMLRAIRKEPETLEAFFQEIEQGASGSAFITAALQDLKDRLRSHDLQEVAARALIEKMALTLEASLMQRFSPSPVSDSFCESRLGGRWGRAYGTLPVGSPVEAILSRSTLEIDF